MLTGPGWGWAGAEGGCVERSVLAGLAGRAVRATVLTGRARRRWWAGGERWPWLAGGAKGDCLTGGRGLGARSSGAVLDVRWLRAGERGLPWRPGV
ncbi:hypothetical protein GCM10009630_50850 [Kribbella jejuensis]